MTVDLHPSLWRVAVTALVIAAAANVMLIWVSGDDDWFANIIGVASAVVAVVLVVSGTISALARWREEALLVAFAIWVANFIEFATQDGASIESKIRQCGFYLGYAILALGVFIAERLRVSGQGAGQERLRDAHR